MNGPAVDVAVGKDVEKGGSEDPKGPRRWWKSTCAVLAMQSWSDFLFAVCFAVGLILLMELTTPTTRTIQVYDATLSYQKNKTANVPFVVVIIVPYILLLGGVGIIELGVTRRAKVSWTMCAGRYLHFVLHGLYCQVFSIFMVELTKPLVGYPRPTFLSTCQPLNTNNVTYSAAGVVCSNTDQGSLNDAREAFPSGHAATATAVMIYIIVHMLYGLYAQPRARVFRFHNRFEYFLWDLLHTISLVYLVAVFCYAWFMGCSRVMSNYHSPADVTAGWVLGISLGLLFGARAIGRAKYLTSDLTTLYYA